MGNKSHKQKYGSINLSELLGNKTNINESTSNKAKATLNHILLPDEEYTFSNGCMNCKDLKELTEQTSKITSESKPEEKEVYEWSLLCNATTLQHNRLSICLLSKYLNKKNIVSHRLGDYLINIITCNNLELFVGSMEFIWLGIDNKLYGEKVIHTIYNTEHRTIFAYFFSNAKNIDKIVNKFSFEPDSKTENYFYFTMLKEIKKNVMMNHIWKRLNNHKKHNLELHIGILRLLMLQLSINKFKILQDKDYDIKKYMFMIASPEERWLLLHQLIITIQGKLPGPYISILHETFVEYLNEQLINEIETEIDNEKNFIRKIVEEIFAVTFNGRTFLEQFEKDYGNINFWKTLLAIIWSVIFGRGFYTRSGLFKERDTLKRQESFRCIREHKHYYNPELPYFLLCNQDTIVGIAIGTRHMAQLFENNSLECLQLNLTKFDKLSDAFYCVDTPLVDMLPDFKITGKYKQTFNLHDVDKFTKKNEADYRKKIAAIEKIRRKEYRLKISSKLINKNGKNKYKEEVTNQIKPIEFDESDLRNATQLRDYLLTMQIVEEIIDPINDHKNNTLNKILKIAKTQKWNDLIEYYNNCNFMGEVKDELLTVDVTTDDSRIKKSQEWMLIKDGYLFYKDHMLNTDLFKIVKDGRLCLKGPRFQALEKHMHPFDIMLKYCKMKNDKSSTKICKVHKDVHSTEKWKSKARYIFEKYAIEALLYKTIKITESLKLEWETNKGKEKSPENKELKLEIEEEFM